MSPPIESQEIRIWRPCGVDSLELHLGRRVFESAPRQFHEEFEIGVVIAGAARVRLRGAGEVVPAGQLVLLEPGVAHDVSVPGGELCDFRVFYVPTDVVADAARALGLDAGAVHFRQMSNVDPTLAGMAESVHRGFQREGSWLAEQTRFAEMLLHLLARHGAGPRRRDTSPDAWPDGVRRARELLHDRLAENVTLDELALAAGLSRYHFLRVFRAATGLPPHTYQTTIRIAAAKRLLRAGLAAGQVALETGFSDQSHFSRHFRRRVGVTPAEFRRGAASRR
ncbi:MAG: helix-turn-helix domain-containing protein [Pseudomonadota bacterium]